MVDKDSLVEIILELLDKLVRQLLPTVPKDLLALDITMPQLKIMLVLYLQGRTRMSDIASECSRITHLRSANECTCISQCSGMFANQA